MGGLLAAEAATNSSYKSRSSSSSDLPRIVGLVAFDTPYLGMHPHVFKSGIASLFAKKDDEHAQKATERGRTEAQMNDSKHVTIVDERVTDGWETFRKNWASTFKSYIFSSHSFFYECFIV